MAISVRQLAGESVLKLCSEKRNGLLSHVDACLLQLSNFGQLDGDRTVSRHAGVFFRMIQVVDQPVGIGADLADLVICAAVRRRAPTVRHGDHAAFDIGAALRDGGNFASGGADGDNLAVGNIEQGEILPG